MQVQKWIRIKLFYNEAIKQHYVQLGDYLFPVRVNVALAIRDNEGLVIRTVKELKEIQLYSLDEDKPKEQK